MRTVRYCAASSYPLRWKIESTPDDEIITEMQKLDGAFNTFITGSTIVIGRLNGLRSEQGAINQEHLSVLDMESRADPTASSKTGSGKIYSVDKKENLCAVGYEHCAIIWDLALGRQIAQLEHSRPVGVTRFSPDNQWLITADFECIKIWQAGTWSNPRHTIPFSGMSNSLTISGDSKFIAMGGWDCTIRLWELETGREIKQLIGHPQSIRSLSFGPNGRYLVSGSQDHSLRIWDIHVDHQNQLRNHTEAIKEAYVSPFGHSIITASYDKTIRIWDGYNGLELGVFRGYDEETGLRTGQQLSTKGSTTRFHLATHRDKDGAIVLDETPREFLKSYYAPRFIITGQDASICLPRSPYTFPFIGPRYQFNRSTRSIDVFPGRQRDAPIVRLTGRYDDFTSSIAASPIVAYAGHQLFVWSVEGEEDVTDEDDGFASPDA